MRKKHEYPKTRKSRKTDYAESTKLINVVGREVLAEIFSRKGMYLASREISELTGIYYSPYVCRLVRTKIEMLECVPKLAMKD